MALPKFMDIEKYRYVLDMMSTKLLYVCELVCVRACIIYGMNFKTVMI